MAVGDELGKLGYNVRILEARDRVGGVNWSLRRGATHTEIGPGGETQVCNFDEGQYHNGGPWRLPLTILSRLDVNLSPETMAAVKATPYSPSAKMGLQMKRRFWEEDDKIFGGHLYSNLPIGDFAYPSWGYFGNKGIVLGFYGNGQMEGLVNKPIKERIEHVLMHASKVHPRVREEFEAAYCTFWEKTPYSLGAYAGGGGGAGDRLAVLGRPDNRIFLGCAAVSGNGGWQEGAIAAAWKQVKHVHERAMATPQTL